MRNLTKMDLEQLKEQLNTLATAHEAPIVYVEEVNGQNIPKPAEEYKAILNDKTGEVETIASKGYVIIQHREAFGAVLDALAAASNGAQFKASVMEQNGRAWMTVVFSDMKAEDGAQGIELGLKVVNSYDKSSALKYSGTNRENHEGRFEFFGLRLACQNGMTVKVSIDDFTSLKVKDKGEAKVGDIVGVVGEVSTQSRHEARSYIRHFGKNTKANVEQVKEMILALPSVARRLEAQIKAVQKVSFNKDQAKVRLAELGFGERITEKILTRFATEEATAWGLYNAITAHATHDEKTTPRTMERSLKAAEALLVRA